MEKLILAVLVAILLVEIIVFINNAMVVRSNYKSYLRDIDNLKTALDAQRDRNKVLEYEGSKLADMVRKEFDATAFVITATDGVKLLPKDWRERLPEKS